jgi:hypothetical protein
VNIPTMELHYAQGDLMRAVQTIVTHKLPLDLPGHAGCERIMREYGEGNTCMWSREGYLQTTINLAQECVREARKPQT